jgi:hypothetical protein
MEDAHRYDPMVYSRDRIDEWKAETLKGLDGADVWAREYLCQWVINKRKMAVPEWRDAFVSSFKHDPYYQFYAHYIGLDWGYKDYTALVFFTWNFRKARIEVEGELTFSGTDVRSDRISEAVRTTVRNLWGEKAKYRGVSDSADPILINEINKFDGMNFSPVHKLNSLEAMLNEFRILVSQGKVWVSPSCPMTMHCMGNAVWDDKRKKLEKDSVAHHFDHLMALVYGCRILDQSENPIPDNFVVDNINVINLNFEQNRLAGTSAGALQEAFRNGNSQSR